MKKVFLRFLAPLTITLALLSCSTGADNKNEDYKEEPLPEELLLATIENNHYESGENHQKKSKRKSHYYNNSKGSTIVLANNAQKIGANE